MVKQIPKAVFPAKLITPQESEPFVDPQRRITANWHRWTVFVDTTVRRMAGWFTFLQLEDTPDSYAGQTLKLVRVNAGETGLEFVAPSTSAPVAAEYVTLATDATLTNERVLTAGTGITITDGGAGNPVTVATTITQYTDEMAQDAIGAALTDTATIDFTYNDGANQITADIKSASVTEAMQVLANNTTNNVSTSKHGYAPILPNDASKYLDGTGAYSTPTGAAVPISIGFVLNTGATGTNVGPELAAIRSGSITKVIVVTKSSDPSTALTFNIKKNGTTIFSSNPSIAAGTSAGTVTDKSSSLATTPLSVAANDVFTIDITSGNANWAATIELG